MRRDHILVINQGTGARWTRVQMPENGIPGNTRILPLTLRGPTAIRIPPKGVTRSDSRHHQKGWETGLWNTKSIPPDITPHLPGKDCREDNGYTPSIHVRETSHPR